MMIKLLKTISSVTFLIAVSCSVQGQDEFIIYGEDGLTSATCLSPTPGIISKVIDIRIPENAETDTFPLNSEEYPGLVLQVATYDTAMYVIFNGKRYYIHEYGELDEEVWQADLSCLYRNFKYPAIAREKGIEGLVLLDVYLDQTGCVEKVEPLTSVGHGLEDAGAAAVNKCSCQWSAATWGGIQEHTLLRLPVNYRLQ